MLPQQPPEDVTELENNNARHIRIEADERRHGVQRVEQKVRIDLAGERVHARLQE